MKKLLIIALTVLLTACGQTLDGTYVDKQGMVGLTFKGNKVSMSGMEWKYEIDGNQLRLLLPQGAMVFTINKDGSIQGMGTKFIKR